MARMVNCVKLQRELPAMPYKPFVIDRTFAQAAANKIASKLAKHLRPERRSSWHQHLHGGQPQVICKHITTVDREHVAPYRIGVKGSRSRCSSNGTGNWHHACPI